MKIVAEKRFKKAFKRVIKKNPLLKNKVLETIDLLENDPFTPSLKSHKLTGNLANLWSCSVTYDYRIIFTFTQDIDSPDMVLILIDIGSHDEVY